MPFQSEVVGSLYSVGRCFKETVGTSDVWISDLSLAVSRCPLLPLRSQRLGCHSARVGVLVAHCSQVTTFKAILNLKGISPLGIRSSREHRKPSTY